MRRTDFAASLKFNFGAGHELSYVNVFSYSMGANIDFTVYCTFAPMASLPYLPVLAWQAHMKVNKLYSLCMNMFLFVTLILIFAEVYCNLYCKFCISKVCMVSVFI
jgi:hypothetical protein